MSREEAGRLADDSRVAFIEQDTFVHVTDTTVAESWGLDRIEQRDLPLDVSTLSRKRVRA